MPGILFAAALLSTLSIGGDVRTGDSDYVTVDFVVPEGTVEFLIQTEYPDEGDVLDWGVWSPEGMRGWSGGLRDAIVIGKNDSSRGYLAGPLAPGTWTLVIGKASIESEAVPWTGTIEFFDEASLVARPRQAFEPVVLEENRRWYAGDFHVHSSESGDAPASLSEIRALAVEKELDFVVLSDHNTTSGHELQAAVQSGMDDLLFVRGNEVTTYSGHGNAMGVGTMLDHRIGFEGRDADDILEEVATSGGVFAINHPNLGLLGNCIGCGWELDVDWAKVHALEVHNGNYDIGLAVFTPQVIELWEEKLSEGHRLAAIGGSDDHRAGIDLQAIQSPIGNPTTWVLSESLSEAALLAAVRQGRTWLQLAGPSSPHIEMSLETSNGDVGSIGDTLRGDAINVNIVVSQADGMQAVVYRDGELLVSTPISGDTDVAVQLSAIIPEGGARYHVEITDGQPKVVTSHFYGDYEKSQDDGAGGCQVSSDANWGWLSCLLLFLLACFRRTHACRGLRPRSN